MSDTTVRPRIDRYLFDYDCANEAVINALVHNGRNISQPLIIFENRIGIFSHGGLPKEQTKELFFKGISKPRNNMLLHIFMNMNLTEHTGHGIPVILPKYGEDAFDINESYIQVSIYYDQFVLATLKDRKNVGLNSTEKKSY